MPPPHPGREIRLLKEGYWDHTAVIKMPDGGMRVRKQARPDDPTKIWGVESLRREIQYLQTAGAEGHAVFPELLDSWDGEGPEGLPNVGYDIPLYEHHRDMGAIARGGMLPQATLDDFQDQLATALLTRTHISAPGSPPLSDHLNQAVEEALLGLHDDPVVGPLVTAEHITLNGETAPGPAAAWQQIKIHPDILPGLDAVPRVRLHGDFFLENILWAEDPTFSPLPQLILIDPVSVAGVMAGPPVFDLIKYESYATGELLALRSEWVEVDGFAPTRDESTYQYAISWGEPGLAPFRQRDWCSRLREKFIERHGPVNPQHYHLIDGYFSVAMALNTSGKQRQARLLKAVREFNAVLESAT